MPASATPRPRQTSRVRVGRDPAAARESLRCKHLRSSRPITGAARTGAMRDPMKAQAAMSQLTREERRAVLELQEQQGMGVAPEATNRQMRRRIEKAQKNAKRR